MIDQKAQASIDVRIGIEPVAEDHHHRNAGQQMDTECDERCLPKPTQCASSINRKPRFRHSAFNCSRVSQCSGETRPRKRRVPDINKVVITEAGMTAIRSPFASAIIKTLRWGGPNTSTPRAPQSLPNRLNKAAAR